MKTLLQIAILTLITLVASPVLADQVNHSDKSESSMDLEVPTEGTHLLDSYIAKLGSFQQTLTLTVKDSIFSFAGDNQFKTVNESRTTRVWIPGKNGSAGKFSYVLTTTTSVHDIEDLEFNIMKGNKSIYTMKDHETSRDLSLLEGTYKILVTGRVTGNAGGEYTLYTNVSPVPEADISLMILLGLGIIALRVPKGPITFNKNNFA